MRQYFKHAVNFSSLVSFIYLVWMLVPVHTISFAEKYPHDPVINMLTTIAFIVVIYMLIDWLREQVVKLID